MIFISSLTNWFLNLQVDNKISLIALLIALYGAILSTFLILKEHFNISLKLLYKNYLTFFSDSVSYSVNRTNLSYYKSNTKTYDLFLNVRLFNNSKNLCTISEFVLNLKYKTNSYTNCYNSNVPTHYTIKNDELTADSYNIVSPLLIPLVKLEPYETKEGFLYFQNLKYIPKFILITVKGNDHSKSFISKINVINCTKIVQ